MRRTRSLLFAVVIFTAACTADRSEPAHLAGSPTASHSATPPSPKKLSYRAEIVGYDEKGRHATPIDQVPDYVAPFEQGLLMGSNRGEWGGELVYRNRQGKDEVLLTENVRGIFAAGSDALVFTGLAHMGINEGAVYRVVPGRRPVARLLHRLIGEPRNIAQNRNGFHLEFQLFEGRTVSGEAIRVTRCYSLSQALALMEVVCPKVRPNNSFKPTPLRGAA